MGGCEDDLVVLRESVKVEEPGTERVCGRVSVPGVERVCGSERVCGGEVV